VFIHSISTVVEITGVGSIRFLGVRAVFAARLQ
jgi:hypothetical protein